MVRKAAPSSDTCKGTRSDGSRCTSTVVGEAGYCFAHDPNKAQERAEARSKGGKHRADVVRLRGLVPPRLMAVYDTLESALGEVHDGSLDPKQASAMAALARAMVSVIQAGELEARVRELEGRDA